MRQFEPNSFFPACYIRYPRLSQVSKMEKLRGVYRIMVYSERHLDKLDVEVEKKVWAG